MTEARKLITGAGQQRQAGPAPRARQGRPAKRLAAAEVVLSEGKKVPDAEEALEQAQQARQRAAAQREAKKWQEKVRIQVVNQLDTVQLQLTYTLEPVVEEGGT